MITVFTTNACAYCKMVKQYLTMKGKEFETINLDENPEMIQPLFEKTGVMTVPVTQIDEKFIIGWDRERFAEVL